MLSLDYFIAPDTSASYEDTQAHFSQQHFCKKKLSCPDKGGKVIGALEDRNGSELPRLLEVGVRVCPPSERVPKELDNKGAALVLANKVEK
eukprot:14186994-Ditylum_brightwellii.AAC.1